MRQIMLAIKMYANENKTLFPPDFVALGLTQDITADVFICPSSNDDIPQPQSNDPKVWAPKMSVQNHTCSYVYMPGHTDNDNADVVIVYEPLDNHDKDGANFGFADGHVDWIAKPIVDQAIKELQAGQNPPPSLK